jgi:prolyl-tRNA synthetase
VAGSKIPHVERIGNTKAVEEFATPNAKTINELIEQYSIDENRLAKSVVYIVDSEPVLILMRGNDELNESKMQAVFGTNALRPAEPAELLEFTGANAGSIGPINLKKKIRIFADNMLSDADSMTSGANRDGFHFRNIDLKRDCNIEAYHDLRTIRPGEPCPNCGKELRVVKAIELGHIFKLGTKYSVALGATFLDKDGKENPLIMGSYGIGVERVMACFIEQNFDENGILWHGELSPFHIHLIGLNIAKDPAIASACEKLYSDLTAAGFDVLYDDRNETPGIKFNDADLIGLPVQVIVGKKNLDQGNVEYKVRRTGERGSLALGELINKIKTINL